MLVVERRPEAVFPLVDRLVNAGADLAEFMGGAGEVLRALLMLQLGNEPEGVTEAHAPGARVAIGTSSSRATSSGCCACSPTARAQSAGAPILG